jgi:hypothetical protein
MNIQVDEVQPGWTVFCSDGEELGTVVGVDAATLRVKKGGFLGKDVTIPRSSVTDVETGRVEISMTKQEVEQQGS